MATTEQSRTQPREHEFRANSADAQVCGSIEQVRLYGLLTEDWFRTEVGGKGVYTLTLADGSVRTLGAKDAAVFLHGIISGYRVLHYHPELLPSVAAAAPEHVWLVETSPEDDPDSGSTIAQVFTAREAADAYAAAQESNLDAWVFSRPLLRQAPARITNFSVRAIVPTAGHLPSVDDVMERTEFQQWTFDETEAGDHHLLDAAVVTVAPFGLDRVAVRGQGTDREAVRDAVRAEVTARLSVPTN